MCRSGPPASARVRVAGCAAGLTLALLLGASACSRRAATPRPQPVPCAEVWAAIQPRAARYRLDPALVYALVAAESNFDAHACNGDARGLLQLTPAAWRLVSLKPYEPDVWDWRKNLAAGIDYLAYARSYLHRQNAFSYPLLLAVFHYGPDYVAAHKFDARDIPIPDNSIYRKLWAGDLAPVPAP